MTGRPHHVSDGTSLLYRNPCVRLDDIPHRQSAELDPAGVTDAFKCHFVISSFNISVDQFHTSTIRNPPTLN